MDMAVSGACHMCVVKSLTGDGGSTKNEIIVIGLVGPMIRQVSNSQVLRTCCNQTLGSVAGG